MLKRSAVESRLRRRYNWLEIALFIVNSAHLNYNEIWHVCEAILGYFLVLARNCLASTLDNIVMQMRKINREKGYCTATTVEQAKKMEEA